MQKSTDLLQNTMEGCVARINGVAAMGVQRANGSAWWFRFIGRNGRRCQIPPIGYSVRAGICGGSAPAIRSVNNHTFQIVESLLQFFVLLKETSALGRPLFYAKSSRSVDALVSFSSNLAAAARLLAIAFELPGVTKVAGNWDASTRSFRRLCTDRSHMLW